MKKTMTILLSLVALLAIASGALAETDTDAKVKALEKRLQTLEGKSAKDRIQWTGDLRVEAHSSTGEVDNYYDGMRVQQLTYGAMFYTDPNVNPGYVPGTPFGPEQIDQFIYENYSTFQAYSGVNRFPETKEWVQYMMANNPGMGAMMKAFKDAEPQPLSELELRARYCELDGEKAADALLSGLSGGSQWLWKGTNLAVLAFTTEVAAEAYLTRSLKEVPAARSGTLLARAAGPAGEEAVGLLRTAMASLGD